MFVFDSLVLIRGEIVAFHLYTYADKQTGQENIEVITNNPSVLYGWIFVILTDNYLELY